MQGRAFALADRVGDESAVGRDGHLAGAVQGGGLLVDGGKARVGVGERRHGGGGAGLREGGEGAERSEKEGSKSQSHVEKVTTERRLFVPALGAESALPLPSEQAEPGIDGKANS